MGKMIIAILICVLCTGAQQLKAQTTAEKSQSSTETPANVAPPTNQEQKLVAAEPGAVISQERIPSGARVYVAPMANGFDNYVVAGLQQKKVPVIVVADRSKAEYEVTGVAETDKAGWAKMLFMGSDQTNETASVKMVNLKTGDVVFAYSVKKGNSVRGKQSAGESCAKHIKEKIID